MSSFDMRKPPVSRIRLFLPGTVARLLARLRSPMMTLRAPNSAAAWLRLVLPTVVRAAVESSGFGEVAENFTPLTTLFNRSAFAVKFCAIWSEPPKFTMAIRRLGPALASMNFAAAWRACNCIAGSMVELSKKSTI